MKKHGFTLAEVLITLGIIGVVAALTTPALVQNTSNAKIGPILQKTVATLENANEMMMTDLQVTTLLSVAKAAYEEEKEGETKKEADERNNKNIENTLNALNGYMAELAKYVAGASIIDAGTINMTTYEGKTSGTSSTKVFHISPNTDIIFLGHRKQETNANGSYKGRFCEIVVDINGVDNGKNTFGKDMFFFNIDNNGKLIPNGSKAYSYAYGEKDTWMTKGSSQACNANEVGVGYGCAGSIFDNNLKVIYK